jgi:hypothetical protein
VYPTVPPYVGGRSHTAAGMRGDNPSGAGNQQERPGIEQWIVGFVDGKGWFSCPIRRNSVLPIGWQLQPAFTVVQEARSARVLELLRDYFGCGMICRNRWHDDHGEDLMEYRVLRRGDLLCTIIPFFEANPLRTAKADDFMKFATIVRAMETRGTLGALALVEIAKIARSMNHRSRLGSWNPQRPHASQLSSDERAEDMVLPPWRHGESKSEIPCRVSSDLHEWRNDLGTVSTRDSAKLQYE